MIKANSLIKHKYAIYRTSPIRWLCTRHPDYPKPDTNCKYPLFKRVREITYDGTQLSCNCSFHHTYGLPCVHLLRLLDDIPDYIGFSHHDVSVSWWKLYHMMVFESDTNDSEDKLSSMKFLKLLKYIKLHEKQGIGVSQRLIDNCQMTNGPMEYFFNQKTIYVNCWNYTTQQLELLFNNDNLSLNEENLAPSGLTQTSNMNPIEDIDFHDDMFNDCDGIPSLYETNTLSNHVNCNVWLLILKSSCLCLFFMGPKYDKLLVLFILSSKIRLLLIFFFIHVLIIFKKRTTRETYLHNILFNRFN